VIAAQARDEALNRIPPRVADRERTRPLGSDGSGDRRADPAGSYHEAIGIDKVEAPALGPACKALPVEHVAIERSVIAAQDRVAGTRDLYREADLVEQGNRRRLVRHRYQRTEDIAEAKQETQ